MTPMLVRATERDSFMVEAFQSSIGAVNWFLCRVLQAAVH